MSSPLPDAPVRFPALASYAGLGLVLSGIVVAVAGGQVLLIATMPRSWLAFPYSLIALGLLALPVGGTLTNARPWAAWAGLGLAVLSGALSAIWGVFATVQGLFMLTPFVGAGMHLVVLLLCALALGPVRRYAVSQRALFAAEPDGPGDPAAPWQPPRRAERPWPQIVALGVAGTLGIGVLGALFAPHAASRLALQARLIASARWPPRADGFVQTRRDYAYPDSPFLQYLRYERSYLPFDEAAAADFADSVAEDVGWRMLAATGAADVAAAEAALWADGQGQKIPLWIAHSLRDRGVFYHPESLLSRSFDPDLHDDQGRVHLDCDQLAHLYAHVGQRLDLNLVEIESPFHVYLQYNPPAGTTAEPLTIEATNFRTVDIDGHRVDYLGEGIGEDYFIDADHHASGKSGTYAARSLIEAAHLYEPADADAVWDGIVANVMVGLKDNGIAAPYLDALRAEAPGSHSYVLVSNLHSWLLEAAGEALRADRPAEAEALAAEAVGLRDATPDLIVSLDPDDRMLLVHALLAQSKDDAAREVLVDLLAAMPRRDGAPVVAPSLTYAEALVTAARLSPPSQASDCDATLGAVLRLEGELDPGDRRWSQEACAQARAQPAACRDVLAACQGVGPL